MASGATRSTRSTRSTLRTTASVLDEIVARRARDIEVELAGRDLRSLRGEAAAGPARRDVVGRLARPGLHLIAEIKRRSPSAGELTGARLDVAAQARAYQGGGAAMISVLVEPRWFGGSLDDLRTARAATSLPVLAKEFVVDARQLPLLRAAGADAVLLLAALHAPRQLARLVDLALDVGLEPLVEAHDARELRAALGTSARLVGINNRDLRTLRVDTGLAERLRPLVPDDRLVVAESGLREPSLARRWRAAGFDAALVGEDLMRSGADPAAVEARVAAYVSAGAVAAPGVDPAADGRAPFVKICGITEVAGLAAAMNAGADAIGLNFVPGTPRALTEDEAAGLVATARAAEAAGNGPLLVGVVADRPAREVAALAARLGLDAVQLHGHEKPADLDRIPLPVLKVLHLPAAVAETDAAGDVAGGAAGVAAGDAASAAAPAAAARCRRRGCRPRRGRGGHRRRGRALHGQGQPPGHHPRRQRARRPRRHRPTRGHRRSPAPWLRASRSSWPAAWTPRTWPRRCATSRPSGSMSPAAWSHGASPATPPPRRLWSRRQGRREEWVGRPRTPWPWPSS